MSSNNIRITRKQIADLLDKQGYCCALTGWALKPDQSALDHKIPLGKGGDHSIHNAQIVHRVVNAAKQQLNNEEFIRMCLAVAAHLSAYCDLEDVDPCEDDEECED